VVYWPPSRAGLLRAPAALDGIPVNVEEESHK